MKITELHIGDKVRDKHTAFPMVVVGIFTTKYQLHNLEAGTVYCDFEGNDGDVFECDVKDLELSN
jgi:hypothetical protein